MSNVDVDVDVDTLNYYLQSNHILGCVGQVLNY
jgi:hypothetical protein